MSPIEEFDTLVSKPDFVLVYYRGQRCPFCIGYIKNLQSLTSSILQEHGTPVVVTAESSEHLSAVRAAAGYDDAAIVDTENLLVTELKKRGLVYVALSDKGVYPNKMAQPAVLVLKNDGKVLYNWAIQPSELGWSEGTTLIAGGSGDFRSTVA